MRRPWFGVFEKNVVIPSDLEERLRRRGGRFGSAVMAVCLGVELLELTLVVGDLYMPWQNINDSVFR